MNIYFMQDYLLGVLVRIRLAMFLFEIFGFGGYAVNVFSWYSLNQVPRCQDTHLHGMVHVVVPIQSLPTACNEVIEPI